MYGQQILSLVKQQRYGLVFMLFTNVAIARSSLGYLGFQEQIEQTKLLQQKSVQADPTQNSAYLDNLQRQTKLLSELRGFSSFDPQTQVSLLEEFVNSNSAYELVGIINNNTSKSNYYHFKLLQLLP
jgi:Na+-translocating ferredoxin:NAD+ oxidoreductase RnfG subunit